MARSSEYEPSHKWQLKLFPHQEIRVVLVRQSSVDVGWRQWSGLVEHRITLARPNDKGLFVLRLRYMVLTRAAYAREGT